ncbi:LysR family transcriptional regulator [Inquilinus sp.]|jgi:DNA-binding transcriptional LysR family regulator|uniref:LysR family transcriptional regulator n=1 Tax=Inquilinus sp. TaxID=1932117 RepID=UPI003784895B
MDLNWLEDYLALAETLSFSRGAARRHVTQPAFSRRIRALEDWVGAPLFLRTTHQVALTPAGAHFQAQAEILVRALHQLRRDTLEAARKGAPPLSIAATHALSFTFFPRWIRRTDAAARLGSLNLVSDSLQACEQMMIRGDVTFLLCHVHPGLTTRFDGRPFRSIVVGHDVLVPFSAPAGGGAPRWALGGAAAPRYLGYSDQSGLGRILAGTWETAGDGPALQPVFTSHLAATLQSMARNGDGLAWLPQTLAEEDVAAGLLVEAGGAEHQVPIEIRLFRPVSRQSEAAEAFWAAFA